jgi:hypothetical protein
MRTVQLIGLALLVLLLILAPAWPVMVLAIGGAIFADLLLRSHLRTAGRLLVAEVWPAVFVVLVYGAVLWGIAGVIPVNASQYWFRSDVASLLQNGRYVELGEAGTSLYLQDCARPHDPVIKVDSSSVLMVRARSGGSQLGPALWEVLFRGKPVALGYKSPC